MNRKVFTARQSAAMVDLIDRDLTTRGDIAEAGDTSDSTGRLWVSGERVPDIHDLHRLACNMPLVAEPLSKLVFESSVFCLQRGVECDEKRSLDASTDGLIASVQGSVELLANWRAAIADKVLTPTETASLLHEVDTLSRDLATFRNQVTRHALRAG